MPLSGLDAARLKVERADQHILDFDRHAEEFFRIGGYSISIETDAETLDDTVKVTAVQALPATFALIVGDALHNLRSALDIAWFDIVGHDAEQPHRVVFPIRKTLADLEAFIKGGPTHSSFLQAADTLTKVIQPYKGGNGNELFILNKLNIADKHQLLIPQVQVATLHGLFVEDDKGERHGITSRTFSEFKPLILKHKGLKNIKVIKDGVCHAAVVFGIGTPAKGRIVTTTLRECKEIVLRTLETLEMLAPSKNI